MTHKTYFTSDTHFFHRNVIKYCNRPWSKYFYGNSKAHLQFATVEEMNAYLIERWNATVRPDDMVYHLGDFSFGPKRNVPELRKLLNGTIIIIKGNHDRKIEFLRESGFEAYSRMTTLIDGVKVIMQHYPLNWETYNVYPEVRGADLLLHGHVHELWRRAGNQINVGCDVWDYKPVTLQELMAVGNDANPVTGHARCRHDPWVPPEPCQECTVCGGFFDPSGQHNEAPEAM